MASFTFALRHDDVPDSVRERAKHLILDSVGIALASTTYPFAGRIYEGLAALGGSGASIVIGMAPGLPLRDAVLMNGALVHGLDYDDTHMDAVVHATCVSFPIALAMAEHLGLHGRELLAAYMVAMESAIRIGEAAEFGFHHRGFHATGVVGHFAGALAAGKLLGLDEAGLVAAQGITGSTAMASLQFAEDGAWNKRLHPGWGGVAGMTAAYLARSGFVAPKAAYEGRYGIFANHLGEAAAAIDYGKITDRLGQRWAAVESAIKPYPTCHFTHAAADATLAVMREHGIGASDVARVRVLIPQGTVPVIAEPVANKLNPTSDYDAKFSVQFIVAACLVRGCFTLAELDDDALRDPAILSMAHKVAFATDPDAEFPRYFSGGVVIETRDGRELVRHERINRGAGDRALTEAEIVAKFEDNAALAISREKIAVVKAAVLGLDAADARTLASALAGAAATSPRR